MDTNLLVNLFFTALFFGIIFIIFSLVWSHRRSRDVTKALNTRVFLVTVPKEPPQKAENEPFKDFKQIIAVAEQMFSSIASLYSGNLGNQLLKDQEQVSFEVYAYENVVAFYVACPKMFEQMVEKQIHAYYPFAHVEVAKTPNIFKLPGGRGDFAVAELKLNKKTHLPIKTYSHFEADPISGVTNAFSKLNENSSGAMQVILRPASDMWRSDSEILQRKIQSGRGTLMLEKWYMKAFRYFFEVIADLMHGSNANAIADPNASRSPKPLSPLQEQAIKALAEKTSKPGFETIIRIVTTGENKQEATMHLKDIISSFSQYGTPDLNSFRAKMGEGEMVKDFILRRFPYKSFILNTEELASIFHFPNQYVLTPNIKWLIAKEMPPPPNLPQEGCIMGKSFYRGVEQMVKIKNDDRQKHIFMIGKTGTGKTTLFTNMIEQDINEGRGCCFIDPLGDAHENLLGKIPPHRINDVIVFDPSDTNFPMGLNMLEYRDAEQRDFLIQEAIEIFYKLFDPNRTGMVGAQWEHWFRNAALTVMSQPGGGTLIDIPRLFTDDNFRKVCVGYVSDPIVKAFWEQQLAKTADFHKSEMYNYFISKFGRFMTNDMMRNIIGQKKSSFDFRQAMDEGKIILVNLSKGKIGEMNSSLLGMIVVNKIQLSAFSRADIAEEQRKDFYLYVDEFQNFTTDNFRTILSEARKYHLDLNITTQYIAQLTESIRDAVVGNAGTMIVYRIGAQDAEFMVKEFPGLAVSDMTNLDRFNTYVKLLIDGTPSKPFSMIGLKSDYISSPEVREQVKNASRSVYARPLEVVNAEISEMLKVPQAQPNMGVNEPIRNI